MSNYMVSNPIRLNNVRLSFPSLFRLAKNYNGTYTHYQSTFLIPKTDNETVENIRNAIEKLQSDFGIRIDDDKINFKDGDADVKPLEGYRGHYYVKKAKSRTPPKVFSKNLTELKEGDEGVPYAGCYVNVIVKFILTQKNGWITPILGDLQFSKDGEPFGSKILSGASAFEIISDENQDDPDNDVLSII